MPRLINPVDWKLVESIDGHPKTGDNNARINNNRPILSLKNSKDHQFHIHPVNNGLVRIVHTLPQSKGKGPRLRNHGRDESGSLAFDGILWEERVDEDQWHVHVDEVNKQATIIRINEDTVKGRLRIMVDFSYSVTVSWYWDLENTEAEFEAPFLCDFKNAYMYDAKTDRVYHQVCREQSYIPLSEHDYEDKKDRYEFIYGLGESKGPLMKDGKRYIMEARDSLAADPQETDPLYKLCPCYLHYNSKRRIWYGLYYNTLSPSIFDCSAEHDFATGEFRSFQAESGPLDYYILLGSDGGKLSSIVSQLARLVTPYSTGPISDRDTGWQASPSLPPLSQFGYLASSLTLSERNDAQKAVVEYVEEARDHQLPIDSMHLSSGYAVDSLTGERNYFTWDSIKYPNPIDLGHRLEKELKCKIIINVKPWLLESHPSYEDTAKRFAFVRAAPDARSVKEDGEAVDKDRCGGYKSQPARTMHWSKGMGVTGKGSYFDFSSLCGCREWQRLMTEGVLSKSITGLWIDNNEFSSMIDDDEEIKGDVDMWSIPVSISKTTFSHQTKEVSNRMGWGTRSISIGSVGRGVLTMGMARATYEHLYQQLPNLRPTIVTRSAVPGMQAFAHGTWSGDNSTTWSSLKSSTRLSLSYGLCFGIGLYGHDIGGFAGNHSPSSQLLIRWCQQSMWHTRFTIHSWKTISTTPWMFGKNTKETEIIRSVIHKRYRLIPMLYSLFVTHYHRKGWPVIKPMLWYHSNDVQCLHQDEQFIVGSHVLVAPVCDHDTYSTTFHLPSVVDGDGVDDDNNDACWFELVANKWHRPSLLEGHTITLDAPIDRIPTLVREGGIIVLGPSISSHIPDPAPLHRTRTIEIYPTPCSVMKERGDSTSQGSFTLIEDDGVSNDATEKGVFTEVVVYFEATIDRVKVGAKMEKERANYKASWDLTFVLPNGDNRRIVTLDEAGGAASNHHHVHSVTIQIEVM